MGAVARRTEAPHQLDLPSDEPADHTLLRGMRATPPARRRRIREDLGCSEIAHARIVEFALDLKRSYRWPDRGWVECAAKMMGLKTDTLHKIIRGDYGRVAIVTVERISKNCGIEPSLFLDPEM
jgi:hypothetical protein